MPKWSKMSKSTIRWVTGRRGNARKLSVPLDKPVPSTIPRKPRSETSRTNESTCNEVVPVSASQTRGKHQGSEQQTPRHKRRPSGHRQNNPPEATQRTLWHWFLCAVLESAPVITSGGQLVTSPVDPMAEEAQGYHRASDVTVEQ